MELFYSLNVDLSWEFSEGNKPNDITSRKEAPSNNSGLERVQSDSFCSRISSESIRAFTRFASLRAFAEVSLCSKGLFS